MMEKFADAFRDEARELLDDMERLAMAIESGETSREDIDALFRDVHTIKGSAGMFGFERLSRSAHKLESIMDSYRSGGEHSHAPPSALASLLLEANDAYRAAIEGTGTDDGAEALECLDASIAAFASRAEAAARAPVEEPATEKPAAKEAAEERSFEINFKPEKDFFKRGGKPEALIDSLMELGSLTPSYDFSGLPSWDAFDPELSYARYSALLTTRASEAEIRAVFDFASSMGELSVTDVTERIRAQVEGGEARIGDILLARGAVRPEDLEEALAGKRLLGEMLIETHKASPATIDAALAEQRHARALREAAGGEAERASIRIKAAKLDELINVIGEIVTVQAHVEAAARAIKDKRLSASLEQLGRLTQDLRGISMGLRMLPIGSCFQRFARLSRDLSAELGKKVAFEASGGSTELDKSVIDKLSDPLVHVIRNSIDHGIEAPAERAAAGKAEEGRITLSAQHAGAWVSVRVEDDGRGLDRGHILAKAVERGLADPKASYTDDAVYAFIMEPGFSTAAKVSEISGRGVGMDVVRRSIRELGGTVGIESAPGRGMAVTLNIPLTMAIIDGLLFKVGSSSFVVPISAVDRCDSTLDMGGKPGEVILVGGALVPVIKARRLFCIPGDPPLEERVIFMSRGSRRLAFVVDEILGGHQTVIKPLGELADYLECMNGASILADGSIAFILDLGRLFARAEAS
jgi:two-component system chemotaxis sensor kinase CheA